MMFIFWSCMIIIQISMSLLVVGSCSRIASNLILGLAKHNMYKSITIADLLPWYEFHQRYYRLRKQLTEQRSPIPVHLDKLTNVQTFHKLVQQHQDVLCVNHDYFQTVTSKQKIMELTATLTKDVPKVLIQKQNVMFVAPVQYDNFAEQNPELKYSQAKAKVKQINPNASFVRSDIQDGSEVYAYLNQSKKIWQQKLLQTPDSFRPKVVNSSFFVQKVLSQLKSGQKSSDLVITGSHERHYTQVAHNPQIEASQTQHHRDNIRLLVNKYRGVEERHSQVEVSQFK